MSTAETISQHAAVDKSAPDRAQTSPEPVDGDFPAQALEILNLWLRWNAVYENVTAAMFERRVSQEQLQESMDLADELRRKAIQLTQELLGR
jgi:hypothetical protein